jgi:putative serine protease PepD
MSFRFLRSNAMYQLSARQILLIALISGAVAATTVACLGRFGTKFQPPSQASNEAAATTPGSGEASVLSDEQNNIDVYRRASPGVVFITRFAVQQDIFGDTLGEQKEGTGSGSVIDQEGRILTNEHVVSGASKLAVSFGDGKQYPATVVGTDPGTDLAVIKVDLPKDKLTVVPFADSSKLVVGQKVLAIGNPFGLDRTLTTGVISGLQRPIRARDGRPIEAIQTDASINPGNSGGPLLDSQGRMVGVNSQILSPGGGGSVGIGFAVPSSVVQRVVPQLIQYGKVRRPRIGVSTRDIGPLKDQLQLSLDGGVLVMGVTPGSGAEAAGIRATQQSFDGIILGDIITAIDGEKVATGDDLYRVLDKHQIGDTVKVDLVRDDKKMSVSVKLLEVSEPRRLPRRL